MPRRASSRAFVRSYLLHRPLLARLAHCSLSPRLTPTMAAAGSDLAGFGDPEPPLEPLLHYVDQSVLGDPEDRRFIPEAPLNRSAFRNTLNDLLKLFLRAPHWTSEGFLEWERNICRRSHSPVVRELVGALSPSC